jgi:hypothetical protein
MGVLSMLIPVRLDFIVLIFPQDLIFNKWIDSQHLQTMSREAFLYPAHCFFRDLKDYSALLKLPFLVRVAA